MPSFTLGLFRMEGKSMRQRSQPAAPASQRGGTKGVERGACRKTSV